MTDSAEKDAPRTDADPLPCGCRGCNEPDCGVEGCACCWSWIEGVGWMFVPQHPRVFPPGKDQ